MLRAYPTAYEVDDDEVGDPDDTTVSAVLGKKHGPVDDLYDEDEQSMFDAYRARFKTSSQPAQHIGGLGRLRNRTLLAKVPPVFGRFVAAIDDSLRALPKCSSTLMDLRDPSNDGNSTP